MNDTETMSVSSQTAASKKNDWRKKWFRKYQIQGFLWMLPAFLLLVLFSYIPPVYALIYSFTDWGYFQEINFLGFQNYAQAFADAQFWQSFGNVILFTVTGIAFGNIAAIALSEMLFNLKSEKLAAALRYLFMLISIVPGVVSILVWEKIIFLPESSSLQGVANALLHLVGLPGSEWYGGSDTIKLSIILTGFPFMGGTSFLIYLAGLQNINESVIEASKLDGLSSWKRIWYIDMPLMRGQLKYFVVTGVIGGIQNYNMQLILQNGNAAMVPGYYIYTTGIGHSELGYACSLGMIMFVIILALTIINNVFIKSKGEES